MHGSPIYEEPIVYDTAANTRGLSTRQQTYDYATAAVPQARSTRESSMRQRTYDFALPAHGSPVPGDDLVMYDVARADSQVCWDVMRCEWSDVYRNSAFVNDDLDSLELFI